MNKPQKNKIPSSQSMVFEEFFFDNQLDALFNHPHKLLVEGSLITLKIKIDHSKPHQLHLLHNQHQLIALVSSYWTTEQYRVIHLISTFFEKVESVENFIHEIEVLTANHHIISADCYTYSDYNLIGKSSIVCEQ
jgi:hypothetical protein